MTLTLADGRTLLLSRPLPCQTTGGDQVAVQASGAGCLRLAACGKRASSTCSWIASKHAMKLASLAIQAGEEAKCRCARQCAYARPALLETALTALLCIITIRSSCLSPIILLS